MCQQQRVVTTPLYFHPIYGCIMYVNNYWDLLFTEEISFTVTHTQ
jgi:hypothetical protein